MMVYIVLVLDDLYVNNVDTPMDRILGNGFFLLFAGSWVVIQNV